MAEIQLIATSWQCAQIITVDTGNLTITNRHIFHEGDGIYFGVSFYESEQFVLCRNYSSGGRNSILVFDRNWDLNRTIDISAVVREGHQIQIYNGKMYIANTAKNCISVFDLRGTHQEDIFPISIKRGKNFHHINSLSICNGSIQIVAANRFRNSFFMTYSLTEREVIDIDAIGLSCHNIIRLEAGNCTCDSFHGSLVIWNTEFDEKGRENGMDVIYLLPDGPSVKTEYIDMQLANFRERRGNPTFPRGLAITGDLAFVGLSDINKRALRHQSPTRVMAIDGLSKCRGGGRPERTTLLELGDFGAMMDLRVFNAHDLGHPNRE